MTLTELIDYIGNEWPTITDANSCARWILKLTNGTPQLPVYLSHNIRINNVVDELCCYWSRHEHD